MPRIVFGKEAGKEENGRHMEGIDQEIGRTAGYSAGTQLQEMSEYHQNDQNTPDIVIALMSGFWFHAAASLIVLAGYTVEDMPIKNQSANGLRFPYGYLRIV